MEKESGRIRKPIETRPGKGGPTPGGGRDAIGPGYSGRAVRAKGPAAAPEDVARAIARLLARPRRREVFVGPNARMGAVAARVAPGLVERAAARLVPREHFREETALPKAGNLHDPPEPHARVHGGWKQRPRRSRAFSAAAVAGVGLGAAALALVLRANR